MGHLVDAALAPGATQVDRDAASNLASANRAANNQLAPDMRAARDRARRTRVQNVIDHGTQAAQVAELVGHPNRPGPLLRLPIEQQEALIPALLRRFDGAQVDVMQSIPVAIRLRQVIATMPVQSQLRIFAEALRDPHGGDCPPFTCLLGDPHHPQRGTVLSLPEVVQVPLLGVAVDSVFGPNAPNTPANDNRQAVVAAAVHQLRPGLGDDLKQRVDED